MTRTLKTLAVGGLSVLAFGWGYVSHRNQIFPYPQAREVAAWAGWVEAPKPARNEPWRDPGALAALEALPYVDGLPDPEISKGGVLHHDPARAQDGVNLYAPRELGEAYLVDMDGRRLWKWSYPHPRWLHVEVFPGGELLVVRKDRELFKLDRRSNLLWSVQDRFHHDVWVADDGTIYAQTREDRIRPEIHPDVPTVVDKIAVFGADGTPIEEISLLDVVLESDLAFLLPRFGALEMAPEQGALDVLHTNHVEVFDGSQAHRSSLFAAGNLLVSMRSLHTIAILDGTTHAVLWAWGPGNLVFQHHPTLLDNGHLLVLSNGTETSEVVEIDPLDLEVVWRYRAPDFFTKTRGSLQRLANGNTLVTETDTGYVFEVTPEGERVWVFANPEVKGDLRMSIWRMTRLQPSELPFLEG